MTAHVASFGQAGLRRHLRSTAGENSHEEEAHGARAGPGSDYGGRRRHRGVLAGVEHEVVGRFAVRCGQLVRVAARLEVVGRLPGEDRRRDPLQPDRFRWRASRRSRRARSTSARATRRSRQTRPRLATAVVQIPWALAGTSIAYNVAGTVEPHQDHWCRAREHLPRQHQEVERVRQSRSSTRASTFPTWTSRPSTAPTVAARATTSPTTSRLSARRGSSKYGVSTQPAFPAGHRCQG